MKKVFLFLLCYYCVILLHAQTAFNQYNSMQGYSAGIDNCVKGRAIASLPAAFVNAGCLLICFHYLTPVCINGWGIEL